MNYNFQHSLIILMKFRRNIVFHIQSRINNIWHVKVWGVIVKHIISWYFSSWDLTMHSREPSSKGISISQSSKDTVCLEHSKIKIIDKVVAYRLEAEIHHISLNDFEG